MNNRKNESGAARRRGKNRKTARSPSWGSPIVEGTDCGWTYCGGAALWGNPIVGGPIVGGTPLWGNPIVCGPIAWGPIVGEHQVGPN